jgi:hypothetical protein
MAKHSESPEASEPMIFVSTLKTLPSFCRAGRKWTTEPLAVRVSDFTPEQLAALKAEPCLIVTEV